MRDAGIIGFVPRGEYSDTETYDFLQFVYYKGSTYVAKKETTGNTPAENNEFWQIIAKGEVGEYLPLTGGTLENKTTSLLALKRTGGNFAALDFENPSGHLFSIEGYSAEDGTGKQLNIFARDWNKSLLRINEKSRVVYDYKTNAEKKIVVEGDALSASGGEISSDTISTVRLKRNQNNFGAGIDFVNNTGGLIRLQTGYNDPADITTPANLTINEIKDIHTPTPLFSVSTKQRDIYDATSKTLKRILVSGEALPITGGILSDNKEIMLRLNNTSENATQTSLCFQHNTISAGLILVDNDGSIHYWDYVHGKTLFWIGKNKREIYDSASDSRKKILVDGDVSHFLAGETFNVKGDTPLAGYVTTDATAIYFTIPLPKSAEGRSVKISCNTWRVRGVQGYIVNLVNIDDYLITTPEISGNLLKLHVRKKDLTKFDNAVNNTPVGVDGVFTIEFS